MEAPKILCTSAWLYCPLLRLLSARRLLSIRDTSSFVSVPLGPDALSRSALIRCGAGFDWSALWYVSSPASRIARQHSITREEEQARRTAEGRVVLDAVVRADVRQVERVRPVVPLQHRRRVVRHVERERRREVERLPAPVVQVLERDLPPVARQDPCAAVSTPSMHVEKADAPWFAIAFSIGQQLRLSVSFGGMYSGQSPFAPGRPSGTTRSAGRSGAKRL